MAQRLMNNLEKTVMANKIQQYILANDIPSASKVTITCIMTKADCEKINITVDKKG